MRRTSFASVVLIGASGVAAILLFRTLRLLRELQRHEAAKDVVAEVLRIAGVLAITAALLLASVRLRPPLRANLALSIVAAAVGIYAGEVFLTLHSPRLEQRLGEKLRVLAELCGRGVDAYPGIEPARFVWAREPEGPTSILIDGLRLLPLAGIARKQTIDCKEGADWLIYKTDEHGFHNPPGLWDAAPLDMAAVGDSFTAGMCVPSDENMVAHLRRRHPATLNLGMAGNGPLLMLAQLREYLPAVRPKVVLWCHFLGNDLLDLRKERAHPVLARYLEEGFRQGLLERQGAVDRAVGEYVESYLVPTLVRRSRTWPPLENILGLRNVRSRLNLGFADPYATAPTEEEYHLFETVLASAKASVERWGGKLYFVGLPPWSEPPRQIGERAQVQVDRESKLRVLAIARRLDLTVIDVQEAFALHPAPESLFACPKCHYSSEGYRLAAKTVLAVLDATAKP